MRYDDGTPLNIVSFLPVYKPAWRYGGPVRSVSKLNEGLVAEGHRVTVVTTNADLKAGLPVSTGVATWVEGVKVHYCAMTPFMPYIESLQLRRMVHHVVTAADVVHLNPMWQPLGLSVSHAATKHKVPYIYSLRGGVNEWSWARRKLKHRIYWRLFESKQLANAAALHVTCEAERDEALTLGVGNDQEFVTVPNCIDTAEYVRDTNLRAEFRERLGLTNEKRIMLFLGRLHPKKGIDITIKASAEILRDSPDWLFVIAGPASDSYRLDLERLVCALGLGAQIRFIDLVDGDTRMGALSATDLFILTSHNENFGMSVIEAMAASAPVVISKNVGISREISRSNAGRVVDLDIAEIRIAVRELYENEVWRKELGERGCQFTAAHFDTRVVAKQMALAYRSLLKDTP